MTDLVLWFDDEFEKEQLLLEKETLFIAHSPHPWIDRDFPSKLKPPGPDAHVLEVSNGMVTFGRDISVGIFPNIASCTINSKTALV